MGKPKLDIINILDINITPVHLADHELRTKLSELGQNIMELFADEYAPIVYFVATAFSAKEATYDYANILTDDDYIAKMLDDESVEAIDIVTVGPDSVAYNFVIGSRDTNFLEYAEPIIMKYLENLGHEVENEIAYSLDEFKSNYLFVDALIEKFREAIINDPRDLPVPEFAYQIHTEGEDIEFDLDLCTTNAPLLAESEPIIIVFVDYADREQTIEITNLSIHSVYCEILKQVIPIFAKHDQD